MLMNRCPSSLDVALSRTMPSEGKQAWAAGICLSLPMFCGPLALLVACCAWCDGSVAFSGCIGHTPSFEAGVSCRKQSVRLLRTMLVV
jgi:hypothetical protein